jgi:uncharacterized protein YndB with AHSA1/START domain
MLNASMNGKSTQVSRIIQAPRHKVYQAFLAPQVLASWFAPETMQAQVHSFEPRQGGRFRISLKYKNP